jgi:competence protein ComGF
MNKYLLFLLLIPAACYGQTGQKLTPNGNLIKIIGARLSVNYDTVEIQIFIGNKTKNAVSARNAVNAKVYEPIVMHVPNYYSGCAFLCNTTFCR